MSCLIIAEHEQARLKVKSMAKHFIEDEHWCYFDDLYSPEYSLQSIYDEIMRHDIDTEAAELLKAGHDEI